MAAGLATLRKLADETIYKKLEQTTQQLLKGLDEAAQKAGVSFCTTQVGSMFGLYFCEAPIRGFADAMRGDVERFKRFFHAMLEAGVYLAPSASEAGFVSSAHGDAEIEFTLKAAQLAFLRA